MPLDGEPLAVLQRIHGMAEGGAKNPSRDAVSLTAGGRAVRLKLLTHGLNVLLVDAASAVAADAAVAQFSVVE